MYECYLLSGEKTSGGGEGEKSDRRPWGCASQGIFGYDLYEDFDGRRVGVAFASRLARERLLVHT